MCLIRLGDIIEGLISIITLGHGHSVALWVALKLGYADCKCEQRKIWLNKLVGCKEKKIKLF